MSGSSVGPSAPAFQLWLSFLYEGVIRERSYFDSEDTITHYRGQPKDIDFPHADLLLNSYILRGLKSRQNFPLW